MKVRARVGAAQVRVGEKILIERRARVAKKKSVRGCVCCRRGEMLLWATDLVAGEIFAP